MAIARGESMSGGSLSRFRGGRGHRRFRRFGLFCHGCGGRGCLESLGRLETGEGGRCAQLPLFLHGLDVRKPRRVLGRAQAPRRSVKFLGHDGSKAIEIVARARNKYETASALTESLRKKMSSIGSEAQSAQDEEASIADLVRNLEVKRAKHEEMSRQITRLETQTPSIADSTRLVSLAELPTTPYFPKRMPFVLGGFVLALMAGIGAALLTERKVQGRRLVPTRLESVKA